MEPLSKRNHSHNHWNVEQDREGYRWQHIAGNKAVMAESTSSVLVGVGVAYSLVSLNRDADGEEDTASKTDVRAALSYGEDGGNHARVVAKGNRSDEDVTEQEDEVSQAEASQEIVEYTLF